MVVSLRSRILFGYIILVAVIGSMAAILIHEPGKFSYISKFHIIISCKLIVYIVMCFYQETN